MPAPPDPQLQAPEPFRPRTPRVIGLLGGIAAGKTAVARIFAAHGLHHVDADAAARVVGEDPAIVARLAHEFGPGILADGRLDRAALARLVFGDAAARARLEAIVHPPIRAAVLGEVAAAKAAGTSVLLDAPLLLENGLIDLCDTVVFVDADAAVRRQRAAARGWSAGELDQRERAQAPISVKSARASHTIRNDGALAETAAQVAALLRALAADPS